MQSKPDPAIYQLDEALHAFGSEEIVKEALRAFLGHSSLMSEQLLEAWRLKDQAQLRQTLHWLKGGLSYMHARPLKAACANLDVLVHQIPLPDLTEAVNNVTHELEKVKACVSLYLAG
jgi:HPt (histidine-containing phosphotransfer) domain-containing protein